MRFEGLACAVTRGYTGDMDKKIPQTIKDFFNKVAPDPARSPVDELQGRYSDKVEAARRLAAGTGTLPGRDSIDYIVELRIREWMMRVQLEAEAEKRLKDLHDRLNKPQDPNRKPPAGPSNNIK